MRLKEPNTCEDKCVHWHSNLCNRVNVAQPLVLLTRRFPVQFKHVTEALEPEPLVFDSKMVTL